MGIVRELWDYARANKKYWILPIVLILLFLAALIIFTESSAIAPFIYTLF